MRHLRRYSNHKQYLKVPTIDHIPESVQYEVAEKLMDDFLTKEWVEDVQDLLCVELSVSNDDARNLMLMYEMNREKWNETILCRIVTYWSDRIAVRIASDRENDLAMRGEYERDTKIDQQLNLDLEE